jgi:hypothetical protein
VCGGQGGALAARIAGKTYRLQANDRKMASLSLTCASRYSTLRVRDDRGEHEVRCGHGAWIDGQTSLEGPGVQPVAASAAWIDDQTWVGKVCFIQTAFSRTLTCRFTGEGVTLDDRVNVAFGPLDRPQLAGRLDVG